MVEMLQRAVVRPPGPNFADGLTTATLGAPGWERALAQHAAYCDALQSCGLAVTALGEDTRYPDSTFVEDTAILTPRGAILTRPGATSRTGEVEAIRDALAAFYATFARIEAPGTLDGGDVCDADGHFFIGISRRTNEAGAGQLAAFLAHDGYTSSFVDIRAIDGILHLKSGIASLDGKRLVSIEALARHPAVEGYDVIPVAPSEAYAANCIRVNGRVLVAAGHPRLEQALRRLRYDLLILDVSEFQKMDGGLSCLSLRF